MPTFRKRGDRWQVQVRRKGRQSLTRSFLLKSDAEAWGRQQEIDADRNGLPTAQKALRGVRLADVLIRYRDEVIPAKRGADRETVLLNAFLRLPIAGLALSDVTTGKVSEYCEQRLRKVKPASLNRELDILRHALHVARKNWDVPLSDNVFAGAERPRAGPSRERRLEVGERDRLMATADECRNIYIRPLVEWALETAMRRGEILNAKWTDLSFEKRTLHIPITKNGHPRTIPLSAAALRVCDGIPRSNEVNIFPLSIDSVKMAWRRIVSRGKIVDLHFHDLRHEAISMFFERGLSVPEVALISGHRDPRMLFRYTHPKAELIALKLR